MPGLPLDKLVPEHLKGVEPYVPSKPDAELMKLYGCKGPLRRLNNNENPLGPCPAALRAIDSFHPDRAKTYPSGDSYYLRLAIASRYGLDPEQIVVGNGANEVIEFVVRGFCVPGDNVVTADKTFAVYEWTAQHVGCETRLASLTPDGAFDPELMLSMVDARTKAVFICNPNNPTGSLWSMEAVKAFLDAIGGRVVVVLDEAYIEFVEGWDERASMDLVAKHPNLLVFRTFSKMYALAGLRIGYLAGSLELVDVVKRTRTVYSVNSLAQEAARASLAGGPETEAHLAKSRAMAAEGRAKLSTAFRRLGLPYLCGEGNFAMAALPFNDSLAYRMLMARGYMVRTMTGFRFPNWIRVTCAEPEAMDGFCGALEEVVAERRRRGGGALK